MDPLSITRSAISLAAACKSLYIFLKKVQDGDPLVISLRKEIHGLEGTFETISGVTASTLANELLRHQWNNVSSILEDCKDCIHELERQLGKPDEEDAVMQRIWKQWKISLKTDDLTALQSQLASYRQNLTLSLIAILFHCIMTSLSQNRSIQRHNIAIASKVDELTYTMHRVERRLFDIPHSRQNESSESVRIEAAAVINDIQASVVSVRAAVNEPISFDDSSQATDSATETPIPDTDMALIENWLRNPLSVGDDEPGDSDSSVQQTTETINEKGVTVTVTSLPSDQAFSERSDESFVEFNAIRSLLQSAGRDFKLANYMAAEKSLEDVCRRSKLKYGDHYTWKDETIELLIRTYYCRSKFTEAEILAKEGLDYVSSTLGKTHPSFYKLATLLMRCYVVVQEYKEAELLEHDLPPYYWNRYCYEVVDLSRMENRDAATRAREWVLQYVLPAEKRWKSWNQVVENIQRAGLSGWGYGCTLIHVFCEAGCEAALRLLLDFESLDLNLDAPDYDGWTPLHLATLCQKFEIVEILLSKKVDTEVKTSDGETALMIAAKNDDEKLIRLLIKNYASRHGRDAFGWTALHLAIQGKKIKAVKALMDGGADIEKKGNHGFRPLHCAVSSGQVEVVEMLLKKGANVDAETAEGQNPLNLAQDPKVIKVLHRHLAPTSPVSAPRPTRKWTLRRST